MSIPYFSVIIPFYNAARTLNRCLDALMRQSYADAEYILIDNNSNDDSAGIVRSFIELHPELAIKLITEKKPGASAARNRGASDARGHWIVFTDSDCIPDVDWLSDLAAETGRNNDLGALAGCIKPVVSHHPVGKMLGLFTLPANKTNKVYKRFTIIAGGGFPTANLAVRSDVFQSIGGFDESIHIYGEDHDLCKRIYESGNHIKALTHAVVYHIHREELMPMIRQAFGFGNAHAGKIRREPQGMFILSMPFITYSVTCSRLRFWIDLNQADKKMVGFLFLGIFGWPFLLFSLCYFLYLAGWITKRLRFRGMAVSPTDIFLLPLLLIIKSAAMTSGRVLGSFRHKVICI